MEFIVRSDSFTVNTTFPPCEELQIGSLQMLRKDEREDMTRRQALVTLTSRLTGDDRLLISGLYICRMETQTRPPADIEITSAVAEPAPPAISGKAASRGLAVGPARILSTTPDHAPIRTGEIVICQSPPRGLASLIRLAGGLVMESGGELSAPSELARELGIPAVVGAVGAASRIRPGQLVAVDGDRGSVRIVRPDS